MSESVGSLRVDRIRAGYTPGRDVLRDISATIESGRLTVIIGPNGSGKSTLAKVLAGLLTPREGRVSLVATENDRDLRPMRRADVASHIAYAPQRSHTSEPMTVVDVVALGAYSARPRADILTRAMEHAGVAEFHDTLFHHLSAGQQQRVTLARTLAQLDAASSRVSSHQQFLIADEPVSAQDPKQIGLVMRCLRDQAASGRGVVVVLHDLTLAARYADTVLALSDEGTLAALGSASQVLEPAVLQSIFGVRFRRIESAVAESSLAVIVTEE